MSGLRGRGLAAAAARPLSSLRVARWAWSSARALDPSLHRSGMAAVAGIGPPPPAPGVHRGVVAGVLRRMGATCLVRAAVLQRWDADHDRPRPLVIGVARDGDGFAAHAWLEGERSGDGFVELHRRPPV